MVCHLQTIQFANAENKRQRTNLQDTRNIKVFVFYNLRYCPHDYRGVSPPYLEWGCAIQTLKPWPHLRPQRAAQIHGHLRGNTPWDCRITTDFSISYWQKSSIINMFTHMTLQHSVARVHGKIEGLSMNTTIFEAKTLREIVGKKKPFAGSCLLVTQPITKKKCKYYTSEY